ncbi:MAG: signal peptidase I [Vulcanimicrobiaceae bacterium]
MPASWRTRTVAHLAWQSALLACIVFALVALRPGRVSGSSMAPRIDSDEYVLIDALAYRLGAPGHGDVVAFRHDRSTRAIFLKRVIGVPGDRVAIERGSVRVDGSPIDEPYVRFHDTRSTREVTVPAGAYYVLGDNRPMSEDSRAWGFVPAGELIGRATLGLWPLQRLGWVR